MINATLILNYTFIGLKTARDFNNLDWVNTFNQLKGFTTIYRSLSYTIHGYTVYMAWLYSENAYFKTLITDYFNNALF